MKKARHVTDHERQKIHSLHKAGASVSDIERAMGRSRDTIKRIVTRGHAERLNSQRRSVKYENNHGLTSATRRSVHEDAMNLVEKIPDDDRDLTGFFAGDPIIDDPRRPWIKEAIERYRGQA